MILLSLVMAARVYSYDCDRAPWKAEFDRTLAVEGVFSAQMSCAGQTVEVSCAPEGIDRMLETSLRKVELVARARTLANLVVELCRIRKWRDVDDEPASQAASQPVAGVARPQETETQEATNEAPSLLSPYGARTLGHGFGVAGSALVGQSLAQPGFVGGVGDIYFALSHNLDLSVGAGGGAYISEVTTDVGAGIGAQLSLRYRFLERGPWSLAAAVTGGVNVRIGDNHGTTAIPVTLRVMATRELATEWGVDFGVEGDGMSIFYGNPAIGDVKLTGVLKALGVASAAAVAGVHYDTGQHIGFFFLGRAGADDVFRATGSVSALVTANLGMSWAY